MGLREQILEAKDVVVQAVDLSGIPGWPAAVHIRSWSGAEREQFEGWRMGRDKSTDIRARVAVLSCCDPEGAAIFKESDVSALAKKNWRGLDRIFDAARDLNIASGDAIEEAEKNSESSQSADSGSD